MVSSDRMNRLFVLMAVAVLMSIAAGCGDDDSTVTPKKELPEVTMQLIAIVSSVSDSENLLVGSIEVGDTISGTYTYNPEAEDDNTAETVGDYRHDSSPYGIFLDCKDYEFNTDLSDVDFLLELVNDHGTSPRDNYLLRSYNNDPVSAYVIVEHISWQLDDASAIALDSIALTSEPPVLSDWTSTFGLTIRGFQVNATYNTFMIRGHVTEVSRVD